MAWAGMGLLLAVFITGCGGGASTESNAGPGTFDNPNSNPSQNPPYTGPVAADADTRQFQTAFWENLRSDTRCGGCHTPTSATPQAPYFARSDDVNLAYSALMDSAANSLLTVGSANTPAGVPYIDRTQTDQSYMVAKVVNHNCWIGSSQGSVCSDIINAYIDGWVGASGGGSTKVIQLTPPATLADPGASKNYPSDDTVGVGYFTTLPTAATSLHGLLSTHCSGCHVSSSRTPQSPYFAESDANMAYEELKAAKKIDLDTPANSRIVIRLKEESHNCWTPNDCASDAQELEDAVTAFSANLTATQIASDLINSKALKLSDAIVAAGGDRYENNAIALYEFKRGTGNVAYDTSGVTPELDLSLSGNPGDVTWVRGYGIEFKGVGKAQGSVVNSRKLYNLIKDIGEYSIEAWVVPSNVAQQNSHIISYMGTAGDRNFTLGQTLYEYDYLNRTSTTTGDGQPFAQTSNETLQATLQHVVVTFDPINGKQVYVNGQLVLTDTNGIGTLFNWDSDHAFVMGNDQGRANPWAGKLRLVAIHNRAMTQPQIQQNFDVGVGAKFLMLFSVREHTCPGVTDPNQCSDFIMFEVSEFDNYSYLFNKPVFVRLSSDPLAADIRISGMRIGLNGQEVAVGQSYRNVDVTVSTTDDVRAGVPLSPLGTIIASQKGSAGDEFFLTFERLIALSTHDYTEAGATGVLVDPNEQGLAPKPDVSDIGVRTYDEINNSMARMTTVNPYAGTAPNRIIDQYNILQQQMPAVDNMSGFLSAHQMGIAQLSIAYCDALINDSSKRSQYFPGFNFSAGVDAAFNTAAGDSTEKNLIVTELYNKMIGLAGTGTALADAPSFAQFKAEMIGPASTNPNNLFDRLYTGCQTNLRLDGSPRSPACVQDVSRTHATIKAMCASALGSSIMLVQ